MKKDELNNIRPKVIFNRYGYYGGVFAGSIFDTDGIAPTLSTFPGGGLPEIFEFISYKNFKWHPEEQTFTPQTTEGCSPAITAACARAGITNMISISHFPIPGVYEKGKYIPVKTSEKNEKEN